MASMLILRPEPVSAFSGTGTNPGLALTPTPKEAWSIAAGATATLDLDMGAAVAIDSFFVGYHNAVVAGQTWTVEARSTLGGTVTSTPVATRSLLLAGSDTPKHAFWRTSSPAVSAPVTSRYWRFTIANPSGQPTLTVPVVAIGLAFQPIYGREYGSGRMIGDTGSNERLFGGDFASEEGAIYSGFSFTLGDLTDVERETLFRIIKRLGTTRSLLVCEDPDQSAIGFNEGLHWSKFRKLNGYERAAVNVTRWALEVDDWA